MPSKYEVAADETVPFARSMIAKALVGKYKMKETEVANYLEVAQAAVSKYVRAKHSKAASIEPKIKDERELINDYISKIAEGKKEYVNVCICRICGVANDFACVFSHANSENADTEEK